MIWPCKHLCSTPVEFIFLSSLIGRHRPPSDRYPLPHDVQYLSVELRDYSVVMGVNTRPQQSVFLLVQAAQVLVCIHML